MSHVGSLDPKRVLLLLLMIQRLGERDLATEPVDAEHSVWIAVVSEIISQGRIRVHVVGGDGRDDCSHFGTCCYVGRTSK